MDVFIAVTVRRIQAASVQERFALNRAAGGGHCGIARVFAPRMQRTGPAGVKWPAQQVESLMEYEYVETPTALGRLVERLRSAPLLGVDTEAAGYHRYHDRISLVQISSRAESFLIDPLASNERAHRFYERLGFAFVERRQFGADDCFVYCLERSRWTNVHVG